MQKADQYFNGLELLLASWEYDDHKCWHLYNWPKEVDDRVMCALYHAEQYKGGPYMLPSAYKDDFQKFREDWAAGTYDPGGTYTFKLEYVEVLEVLAEEAWHDRGPGKTAPAPQRKKKRRGKKRRKRHG